MPAVGALLPGSTTPWVLLTDQATGLSYYANTETKETSWEVPAELGGAEGMACPYTRLENGWFRYEDDQTGRPYYYNVHTQQTEWSMPPDARARKGSIDDDYISDDESSMPPPIPSGAQSSKVGDDDEDDIDGAEDDVIVRRLSEAGRGLAEDTETKEAEAARKAKEKSERKKANRVNNLKEFVKSERTYVDKIHILEKVYVDPLRIVADMPKGAIFSHADLDAVFLNITVISKVNTKFVEELEEEEKNWPNVNYAPIVESAAKKFKGCYTRYVNNFDAADARLNELKTKDKEKHRYLEVCKTHPDAKGLDVRSYLMEPVQRMMRYPMLLKEILDNTEPDSEFAADIEPYTTALEACKEIAKHINEDKRKAEQVDTLQEMVKRFTPDSGMDKELVRYERKFLREGTLTKARLQRRQKRYCFLFNDLMVYAVQTTKGYQVKGKIVLDLDARVEMLPNTETMQHAFAVIEKGGKGYTWLTDSATETHEWFEAIDAAIKSNKAKRVTTGGVNLLQGVQSKPLEARLAAVQGGATLMKYNQRDGKSGPRWVKLTADNKICWGDTRTKDTKSSMKLDDAIALLHGAKSSAFFKQQHAKKDQDWLCFSVVFKGRGTLDFAATNADSLLDWYLALASKVRHSTEALLDEAALRARIEGMF